MNLLKIRLEGKVYNVQRNCSSYYWEIMRKQKCELVNKLEFILVSIYALPSIPACGA
jgi:hypothetical protein